MKRGLRPALLEHKTRLLFETQFSLLCYQLMILKSYSLFNIWIEFLFSVELNEKRDTLKMRALYYLMSFQSYLWLTLKNNNLN